MRAIVSFVHRDLAEGISDWKHTLFRFFFQPLIYLIVFGVILGSGQYLPGGPAGSDYRTVVAPGILAMLIMNVALGGVGDTIVTGYYSRCVEAWLQTPISVRGFMVAKVLSGAIISAVAGLAGILVIRLVVGLAPAEPLSLMLFILLGGVTFSLLSLLAFVIPRTPDKAQEALSFILMPMMFFGCTFYTYSSLPHPWNTLALLFPTTYLSEALRAAYNPQLPHMDAITILSGFCVGLLVLFYAADRAFQRRLADFQW